jgi:hypothetical protein
MKKIIFAIMLFVGLSSQYGQCGWFDIRNERDYITGCLWRGDPVPDSSIKYILALIKEEPYLTEFIAENNTQEDLDDIMSVVPEKLFGSYDEDRIIAKQENFKYFVNELLKQSENNISLVVITLAVLAEL